MKEISGRNWRNSQKIEHDWLLNMVPEMWHSAWEVPNPLTLINWKSRNFAVLVLVLLSFAHTFASGQYRRQGFYLRHFSYSSVVSGLLKPLFLGNWICTSDSEEVKVLSLP